MAFRRYVIAVLLFVAVAGMGFALLEIADASRNDAARTGELQVNESISQETGLWQFVNRAIEDDTAGFNETVTVYNASDAELVPGTDYEWNSTDGTIKYSNTANVTDGATGNITYAYFQNTRSVNVLSRVVTPVVTFLSWSPLLVGGIGLGVLLLAAVAILMRYVGGSSGPQTRR